MMVEEGPEGYDARCDIQVEYESTLYMPQMG
jgi:hypothetical protein